MTPLELLKAAQESKDLQRNVSTATLLWAVCSIVAVALKQFGLIANYEQGLTVVTLVTWIGVEVTARIPKRVPVATCETCYSLQVLPMGAFRRFWPWKRCTLCGGYLRYTCSNGHLLSLFDNEKIEGVKRLRCSRCGETHLALKEKEFLELMYLVARHRPKEFNDMLELIKIIWTLTKGTKLQSEVVGELDSLAIAFLLANRADSYVCRLIMEKIGMSWSSNEPNHRNRKKREALLDILLETDLKKTG